MPPGNCQLDCVTEGALAVHGAWLSHCSNLFLYSQLLLAALLAPSELAFLAFLPKFGLLA